ncbi:hypothetical protein F5B22DRAFT_644844 [Xylaria bambusicola]|uniref:uncharacterized protein n=1 Tax=Xylaria bambusicola TaxID=326684 RepID=UPI002007F222|nr:uncharacterized protein F5B22DRAFT_644844 [Xylaria bambusicola]KAI0518537.1 hypothetical protein F5B22DRAFT_644844 [Xylaria bambusicola]
MSFARNYVPLGLAIVFGIANGYYAFQPDLKEQHQKTDLQSELLPQSGRQGSSGSSNGASK